MKKQIWSYAVVQSIFGTLWVGKSKRKADNKRYFSTIDEAINLATMKFEDAHLDFNEDDENDYELCEEYHTIVDATIDDVEIIRKPLEKFVI